MADELDPILEARLRGVLKSEADSIPFTLRADTVRRVGAERHRARNTQRLTMYAAAAVVLVAVAGLALSFAMRSSSSVAASPSASTSGVVTATPDANGVYPMSALNSALVANGVTPLLGLGLATTDPSVTSDMNTMGPLPASDQVVVALSCAGGSVHLQVVAAGSTVSEATESCDTSLTTIVLNGTKTASGGEATIQVVPQAGVRWRLAAGVRAHNTPDPSALPAWDALHAFIGTDTVIAAQGGSSSDSTVDEFLGPLGGRTTLRFVAACRGQITLSWASAAGEPASSHIGDFPCDGAPHMMALPTESSAPGSLQLLVSGGPGSSWMGIVVDLGARSSSAPAASGLLTPSGVPAQGTTVSSYYGDLAGGGTVTLDGGSPSSPSDEVVVSIKCAGQASLTVMVDGLMKDLASSDCANSANLSFRPYGGGQPSTVQIGADQPVSVGVVVTVVPSAANGLPTDATLLAAAGQGAVQLQAAESAARTQTAVDPFKPLANRVALAVVVACTGDQVDVIDTAAADSPLETVACDNAPHAVPWNGWARVVSDGPTLGLSVPSGTTYRAVLADTSAVALDGETNASSNGLPTRSHLEAGQGLGIEIGMGEQLNAASTVDTVALSDIRGAAGAQVLLACVVTAGGSGSVDVVTETAAGDEGRLGSAVCDGTVQAFLWNRGGGVGDASSIRVRSPGGTTWRAVVLNNRGVGPWHSTPSVACRPANTSAKSAPASTLHQGGSTLGTVSVYTESWTSGATDGIPVTPSVALEAAAGTPFTLRIAGDVCANAWSVVYGPTKTDGSPGIDPVGVLAVTPQRATTGGADQQNRENRIDLPSLPSGDWVLMVNLGFDVGGRGGDAAGVIRVHVP